MVLDGENNPTSSREKSEQLRSSSGATLPVWPTTPQCTNLCSFVLGSPTIRLPSGHRPRLRSYGTSLSGGQKDLLPVDKKIWWGIMAPLVGHNGSFGGA